MLPMEELHSDASATGSLLEEVFKLYTARSGAEVLRLVRARYSPQATFVDPLVLASPRSSIELQFFALQKIFSTADVELRGEPEVTALPGHKGNGGLLQIVVPNTQRYAFSRHTGVAKNVLPEGTELQVTTTLIVDPHTWQVVRHEDVWQNPEVPHLPMLWRRFNAVCTSTVFRLIGWNRELQGQQGQQAHSPWAEEMRED